MSRSLAFLSVCMLLSQLFGCCSTCQPVTGESEQIIDDHSVSSVTGRYVWDKDDLRERMLAEIAATEDPE